MLAELVTWVEPNEAGNLPVYRVFGEDGEDLGLWEAYDSEDAILAATEDLKMSEAAKNLLRWANAFRNTRVADYNNGFEREKARMWAARIFDSSCA